MPHLDDGTLHAYLDGALEAIAAAGALPDGMLASDVVAHLEHCSDCRARLEQERVVRERAGHVLRAAAPERMLVPPLASASGPARRRRSFVPLAWAASLVLAVGAGWWGSQIARDPRVASTAARAQSEAGTADALQLPEAEARDMPAGTAAVDAAAPQQIQRPAAPEAAPPAAREQAGNVASRSETAPARERSTSGVLSVPPTATDRAQPDADRAPPGRAGAERAVAAAPPPPAPPPPAARTELNDLIVTGFAARTLDGAAGFAARDSAGGVLWRPLASGRVLALVDAEITAAEVALEIGSRVTRVTQRLGTGESAQVIRSEPQAIALESLVVTGDSAAPRQRRMDLRSAEAASAPQKAVDEARGGYTLLRGPTAVRAGVREMMFTSGTADGWIIVRAPAWLSPDDVQGRLGAVSVAPASR